MSELSTASELRWKYDHDTGLLLFNGRGLFNETVIRRMRDELPTFFGDLRNRGVPIRALCDLADMPPQTQDVVEQLTVFVDEIYEPEDRVALLMQSSLAKLQMRRIVTKPIVATFLSANAAKTWLLAYDSAGPATARTNAYS